MRFVQFLSQWAPHPHPLQPTASLSPLVVHPRVGSSAIRMDCEPEPPLLNRVVPNLLQAEAIRSSSNAVLMIASPGTGKTRVIRARLAYLMGKGVPASSILVVTFTQHAAEMLKTRVQVLGTSLEGVHLGTFHSVCAKMLREHAALLGLSPSFRVLMETEQLELLSALMRQVGMAPRDGGQRRGGASDASSSGSTSQVTAAAILRRIQCWKERGLRPDDVHTVAEADVAGGAPAAMVHAARNLYPLYQRGLHERGTLDYTDLTLATLRLFESHPHVLRAYRRRFRHLLVDELQDTSAVQYEWLRKLAGAAGQAPSADRESFEDDGPAVASSIFAAADDDQSIYGWRGASRDNVLRFPHDWPRTEVIRMAQSYRCSPHVLASALPLLQHADSLVPKSPFTRLPPANAARVLLRGFWDSTQEGAWIASQIRARVLGGQSLASIAVLVRSQEQAKSLLPHLVAAGIPVAMQPLGAVDAWWNAHEVRCAVNALRLVRSTADDAAARELLGAWAGLSRAAIDTLQELAQKQERSLLTTTARALQHERLPRPSASRLTYFFARFAHWQSLAKTGGLPQVLGAVASDHAGWCTDGGASMRKLVAFAQRCGSFGKLLEHSAFKRSQPGAGTSTLSGAPSPSGSGNGRGADGAVGGGASERRIGERRTGEPAVDEGAISLLTIHKAKGLEWDTVFLPGWEQGTFPLAPSTRLGSQGHDEEWRLAYVALTRAKHFAGITHVSRRNWQGRWQHLEPSTFLQVLPSSSVASFAPNTARPYYQGAAGFRATNSALFNQRRSRLQPRPLDRAAATRVSASARIGAAVGADVTSRDGQPEWRAYHGVEVFAAPPSLASAAVERAAVEVEAVEIPSEIRSEIRSELKGPREAEAEMDLFLEDLTTEVEEAPGITPVAPAAAFPTATSEPAVLASAIQSAAVQAVTFPTAVTFPSLSGVAWDGVPEWSPELAVENEWSSGEVEWSSGEHKLSPFEARAKAEDEMEEVEAEMEMEEAEVIEEVDTHGKLVPANAPASAEEAEMAMLADDAVPGFVSATEYEFNWAAPRERDEIEFEFDWRQHTGQPQPQARTLEFEWTRGHLPPMELGWLGEEEEDAHEDAHEDAIGNGDPIETSRGAAADLLQRRAEELTARMRAASQREDYASALQLQTQRDKLLGRLSLLERLEAKGGRTAAASSAAEEAADADEVLHMCSDLLNVLVTTAGEIAASQHQPHDWSA